jgi:outer membrane protein assembly factor BamA
VKYITIYFLVFFIATALDGYAQAGKKERNLKVLPVPAFGYSPETKFYLGAVTLFSFKLHKDSTTRTSNAKLEFNYTWRKQVILEGAWNCFFKGEKWFTKGLLHYSKYPDYYYGIGAETPESNKLIFTSNRFVFETFVLKKIGTKLFSGLNLKHIDYSKIKWNDDEAGYRELISGSVWGIGVNLLKDSRNNLLTPTKGALINFNSTYNFSQTDYLELSLDMRYYKTWKSKFTFASRFINEWNFGNPPFYDLVFLGGDKYVRGYYYGRFRDKCLSSLQTEFRFPVVWRIGLSAFGGISSLYPNVNHLDLNAIKTNYGIGLRFLVDKKDRTNLRFDYAIGQHQNNGFYVSFGESF